MEWYFYLYSRNKKISKNYVSAVHSVLVFLFYVTNSLASDGDLWLCYDEKNLALRSAGTDCHKFETLTVYNGVLSLISRKLKKIMVQKAYKVQR